MLYTHSWGIFFGVGAVARADPVLVRARGPARGLLRDALLALRRRRACSTCRGCRRCSTRLQHTAAPWANKPRFGAPIQISRDAAGRRPPGRRARCSPAASASRVLAARSTAPRSERERLSIAGADRDPVVTLAARLARCRSSRRRGPRATSPPSLGPLLLLLALGLSRAGKLGLVALVIVCVFWINPTQYVDGYKSDVRDIGARGRRADETRRSRARRPARAGAARLVLHARRPQIRRHDRAGERPAPHELGRRARPPRSAAQPGRCCRRCLLTCGPARRSCSCARSPRGSRTGRPPGRSSCGAARPSGVRSLRATRRCGSVQVAPQFYRGASTVGNSAVLYEKTARPQLH